MKIVWREWFNEAAVASMNKLGTLPRNELEILGHPPAQGTDAARMIAEDATEDGSHLFREGAEIVIIEPAEFAGDYHVSVDYAPSFHAYKM